jgi:hypothetical protein
MNLGNDSKLVLYDQMRAAIAKCAEVDEAAGIKNQAAQLEAYARVRDDVESQRRFAEIRLRACMRIGEISRDMEKGHKIGRGEGEIQLPTDGKLKSELLEEAGISTSTANRYEELAGGKEKQAQTIAAQAAETYFAQQREKQEPSTMNGLKQAITGAVITALGVPPTKPKKGPPALSAQDTANMNWNAWIMNLDRLEPELAADGEVEEFAQEEFDQSERAIALVRRYQARMKTNFNVTAKA